MFSLARPPGPYSCFSGVSLGAPGLVLALIVVGPLGCGTGGMEETATPPFEQIDSAGVLISLTRGTEARVPIGWAVDSVPDLVLGTEDSPSGYLHRVQGLKGLPDGGVLVVDGGSQELRFFDREGRLVKRAGGAGEGPGEFRDPVLVPLLGTDSLLLFDKGLPRFQVLSGDGQYSRQIRHEHGWPHGRRAPLGAVDLRHMLFWASGTVGGEFAPREEVRLLINFFWYDPFTGERLLVDSLVNDALLHWDGSSRRRIPFTARSAAVVTERGVFITRGATAEILEYDVEAMLRRILRVKESGRPVTRDMIEAMIDLEVERVPILPRDEWERTYRQMPIPDTLPAFQALRVDELGWLWAEVYDFDPRRPRQWVVFDSEGRAHGTVETPVGLEVQWIGRDAILGVWRDEFDVEYVHRYPLDRRGGAPEADPEG